MSYLSGRHMSHDDYYRSGNDVSDSSERHLKEEEEGIEGGTLLAGDQGGRGVGVAGDPDTLQLAGAGDDAYAGYDPGMAGCTLEPSTCHIPGISWIGSSPTEASTSPRFAHLHVRTMSRGYERDEDEYAESLTSQTASASGAGGEPGPGQASAPAPVVEPNPPTESTTVVGPVPVPAADSTPETERPPLGTRLVGRVERLAGRVLRDPEIQARGKRHMTGHL